MNFRNNQQQQHAISIFELLLVLAIVAVIIFIGFYRYQTQQRLNELAEIQQNIHYIFHAMNQYYRINCTTQPTHDFTISMQDLAADNLLPQLAKTNLLLPWSDGYAYRLSTTYIGQTKDSKQDIYQLNIQAQLNAPLDTMEWYRNKLDAFSYQNNTLTWVSLPSYVQPTINTSLWIMDAGAGFNTKLLTNYDSGAAIRCGY